MVLHVVDVGRRCCPRAAPCWWQVPPCVGAATVGAAALAVGLPLAASQRVAVPAASKGDSPGRVAAPCGLTTGSHPLWPGRGCCLHPQAPPILALAMPMGGRACWRLPLHGALDMPGRPVAGGLSRSRLPRHDRGWPALHGGWPWLATPTWGLAVAGHPCSSLPSPRKHSKNA
ncbi:hypothetical protein B296_00034388 [Ensete ventricosum]|uniref:Uncharacterized protein n=1 Tax=Ensete ventricosum TaxID=4639 RepID=A0A426YPB7_ENSVE|nr:hypothetical protein B296_00034388 [Ensete ventricosum]